MKYEILGDTLPVVVCNLEEGECMINESGAMSWCSPNMDMQTTTNGGIGKALGRMFSGDKLFQNRYTALGSGGTIAFSSCFPGKIVPFEITENHGMILQKSSFLASVGTVELSAHFQKRIGVGFFGGEGFILQRLSGHGTAFAEFDGHVVQYELKEGQRIVVSTGHLAAMEESVDFEIQTIKGAKNIFFGGEGLFNCVLTGPGNIWLQTMPISKLAQAIIPYIPTESSSNGPTITLGGNR